MTVVNPPLPSAAGFTMSAAYFFFFRSSIDLKMPSISISRSLYRLFTSFFSAAPIALTSCKLVLFVLIMIESVSP